MMSTLIQDLTLFAPEVFLFCSTIVLLMAGLYGGRQATQCMYLLGCLVAMVTIALLVMPGHEGEQTGFEGLLISNTLTDFAKILVLIGTTLVMILSHFWMRDLEEQPFEFAILVLLASLGMMLMVSANNLLSVYMSFELMSLSLYILAAIRRDSLLATEAGVKYFVLGSLASGILLFGMSLIYGFVGSTSFVDISSMLDSQQIALESAPTATHLGLIVGMVLMIVGLCFKVSAVPFHMWTPDVYQGAPTPVTAFFAIAPKVAALVLFARLLLEPFGFWIEQWQPIMIVVSAASMLVGAFGALVQTNIKRLLAYSSIGHVGYALMGVAAGSLAGLQGLLIYLSIYLVMTAGMFGCVLLMRRGADYIEDIDSLSGLSRSKPYLALAIAIMMFSLAGIPPLAGFFGKMYVFLAALEAGMLTLAVIGVLSSVVAAYYYLKIVKLMYFDEEKEPFSCDLPMSLKYLLVLCVGGTLLFFLFPAPLVQSAQAAAGVLWP